MTPKVLHLRPSFRAACGLLAMACLLTAAPQLLAADDIAPITGRGFDTQRIRELAKLDRQAIVDDIRDKDIVVLCLESPNKQSRNKYSKLTNRDEDKVYVNHYTKDFPPIAGARNQKWEGIFIPAKTPALSNEDISKHLKAGDLEAIKDATHPLFDQAFIILDEFAPKRTILEKYIHFQQWLHGPAPIAEVDGIDLSRQAALLVKLYQLETNALATLQESDLAGLSEPMDFIEAALDSSEQDVAIELEANLFLINLEKEKDSGLANDEMVKSRLYIGWIYETSWIPTILVLDHLPIATFISTPASRKAVEAKRPLLARRYDRLRARQSAMEASVDAIAEEVLEAIIREDLVAANGPIPLSNVAGFLLSFLARQGARQSDGEGPGRDYLDKFKMIADAIPSAFLQKKSALWRLHCWLPSKNTGPGRTQKQASNTIWWLGFYLSPLKAARINQPLLKS